MHDSHYCASCYAMCMAKGMTVGLCIRSFYTLLLVPGGALDWRGAPCGGVGSVGNTAATASVSAVGMAAGGALLWLRASQLIRL